MHHTKPCPACHGEGELWSDDTDHRGEHRTTHVPCEQCDGTGKVPWTAEDAAEALAELADHIRDIRKDTGARP
jgi:DnaJ-class molecular chaperone